MLADFEADRLQALDRAGTANDGREARPTTRGGAPPASSKPPPRVLRGRGTFLFQEIKGAIASRSSAFTARP